MAHTKSHFRRLPSALFPFSLFFFCRPRYFWIFLDPDILAHASMREVRTVALVTNMFQPSRRDLCSGAVPVTIAYPAAPTPLSFSSFTNPGGFGALPPSENDWRRIDPPRLGTNSPDEILAMGPYLAVTTGMSQPTRPPVACTLAEALA